MKKEIFCAAIVVWLCYATAWPQGLGQMQRWELTPWWDRPVVRDLGLSEDQLSQVKAIIRESRDHLIELRAAVRSAESALADEMSEERVDMRKAEAAIDRVVSARAELMRATAMMSLRLRQVLTSAQWQELRKRGAQQVISGSGRRQRARAGN